MRRLPLLLATGLFLLLCCGRLAAQQPAPKPVNLILNDTTIDVILQEFEKQSGYHFYYDRAQFDSLRFSIVISNQPLQKALEQTFENTQFHFTIMADRQSVFITKGVSIKTSLPENFFAKAARDTTIREVAGVPDFGDKKKVRVDASVENRLFEIGNKNNPAPGNVTLAGVVRNVKTGEPVVGATIAIPNTSIATATDQYGYYSLTIPKGRYVFSVQGLGMKDTKRQVVLYTAGNLNIEMDERVTSLKEVIVSAAKVANVRNVQMGTERLTIRAIKQIPTAFGEADIIKAVLTLPGVKSVGEASTGFNVRGGSADQNLILFNDATIYNPSHFFGFFSAFNPDIVKDVELYKSSIPAKYGGRLASVLDISSREGNKKEFTGSAGIGLITSRFNIEGPIQKDKTSFILGARTTYAGWLLNLLPDEYENSKASFYDVNLNISHQFDNKKDYLYATGYISGDRFNLNNDTTYGYNNGNVVLKWKHIFNNKLTGFLTAGYDRYAYHIQSEKNKLNAYKLGFDINQLNAKADFTWYLSPEHTIDFGASTIRYKLNPGNYEPLDKTSMIMPDKVPTEQAQESAIYLSERWNVTPELSIQAGARYSFYQYLGPGNINQYAPGIPKTEDNITGVGTYGKGDVIKTYHGPEWRVSARYSITPTFSVKAGYNTQRQYIHMLSNTTAISPTDIWKLSDPNIKPQFGDQVSFGLYKNLRSNSIETSVEVYYKNIKDYLDYKSGANLIMNDHIETDVIGTRGRAYGLELMIKKQNGKLNGWISYTYSRILLKMDDPTSGEQINRGEEYPANYDKPHDVTMVSNYRFTHRFSISLNATYSTGRPVTLPIGRYYYGGSWRALYADRNAYRIPDYFRTDFAMIIDGNHKVHQKFHNSWTIGLYNITGRKNPYSVYFTSENGRVNGYRLSIFGNIIPFINYNIRF
ncbi:TonB-dependent receptor [Paraflavitalea pollutisoli]|uniref:TonB-dependent receptor n=1 Tax=Paraflavitalea pollutisoli TaxID=3034143 RepID=UPI0023EC6A97|nr:TonB-dependent receptor [Paraflavitalea sp. H1-2-19X]